MPGGASKHELTQDVEKLKNKYGTDALMNIVGRNMEGEIRKGANEASDGLGQKMAGENEYPVRMYHPDPYDTVVDLKTKVANKLGAPVQTAEDLEWLRRKQDQMNAAQFKQFVASLYNTHDPAQKALLHKVYPELLDEQAKVLDERMQLMAQLAKIRLYGGPRNRDDLMLLWALNSGAVKLPEGNPWTPSGWDENKTANGGPDGSEVDAFQRGIFSPIKTWKSKKQKDNQVPFNMLGANMATGGKPEDAAWPAILKGAGL
jgi:hypothetical protein